MHSCLFGTQTAILLRRSVGKSCAPAFVSLLTQECVLHTTLSIRCLHSFLSTSSLKKVWLSIWPESNKERWTDSFGSHNWHEVSDWCRGNYPGIYSARPLFSLLNYLQRCVFRSLRDTGNSYQSYSWIARCHTLHFFHFQKSRLYLCELCPRG